MRAQVGGEEVILGLSGGVDSSVVAELLAEADAIFIEELRKADLYDKISQAFAVFLPVKSVRVVGDARAYEWVIALRAVETIDFMTAYWAHGVRCQAAEGNRRRGSCRTAWRIPLARTVPIACARSVRMQLQASVDRPATWRTLFRKANAMCP
ncbi:hypothetical protein [Xanthomonas translucens]|uniref:GMP synthase (glutamine-hydrolyzing) n=1 Tax=Xanthomonas campestris pv. translucens TaxID=343 RepID=UPI003CF65623